MVVAAWSYPSRLFVLMPLQETRRVTFSSTCIVAPHSDLGRPFKLTPHQQQEAIKRRDKGEENPLWNRPELQRPRRDDFETCAMTTPLIQQIACRSRQAIKAGDKQRISFGKLWRSRTWRRSGPV